MEATTVSAVSATFVEAKEKALKGFIITGTCHLLHHVGTAIATNGNEYNVYAEFEEHNYIRDTAKYDDVNIAITNGKKTEIIYNEQSLAKYVHNYLANPNWRPGSNSNVITCEFIFFIFVTWLCDVKLKDLTDAKLRPRVEEIIKKQSEIKERYNEIRKLHWQYSSKNVIIEYDGNKYDLHERFYELDKIMETKLTYDDLREDCKKLYEEFIKQDYD